MTPERVVAEIYAAGPSASTQIVRDFLGAALRERDAAWAAAVNAALGICIWPYHEVCDRCRPLRALLEEAGK